MPRLKLVVAYVGTDFHGWQTQTPRDGGTRDLATIQSLLEREVSRIVGTGVHVHGAGRTDAGVHAEAQVAHVDVPEAKAGIDWQLALNTSLPPSIRVASVERVPDSFHAQHSARRKTYEYRLWLSRRYMPPQLYPFAWACGPVRVERMDAAARLLVGRHDFSSLKNSGTEILSAVRTITSIRREPEGPVPEESCEQLIVWRLEADGFLKQMVRNIMGLLVAVGRGKLEVEAVPAILEARDRRRSSGVTAPARGLTLKKVWYDEDLGDEPSFN